ncbi:hypothetical protein FA13DRAFT_1091981 [Coprinellus micaceus]|uniref:Uncharacterized protein n=1 Tax=Coprinellus micaceus TaxID=71717 RepID=A0A4Y7TSS9_COPMI|nr:hypothetical protein FA13DRAFT_1091981 [Coprinellus micaceus]
MGPSTDEIEALSHAVAAWRLQEYIALPLYTLYIHFCLFSMDDEVSDVMRRDGKTGKLLFFVLKYGTIFYIASRLPADYRTYFVISRETCKVLGLMNIVLLRLTALASDVAIGLCVSVLLDLRRRYLAGIMLLCSVPPTVYFFVQFIAHARIPAEPITDLRCRAGLPMLYPFKRGLGK